MKKRLLFIFGMISCWISSYSQAPDLIYYKFEDSSQVRNYATDPVGWLSAAIDGSFSIDTGGFLGTYALADTGSPGPATGIETGWKTDISKSFTFSFWLYNPDSISGGTQNYIFGDSLAGIRCFSIIGNGSVTMLMEFPGQQWFYWFGSSYVPHVFHYVYDDRPVKGAPYGRYKIYMDGISSGEGNLTSPWHQQGSGLVFGYYEDVNNLAGKLDEFRWYDRALTANEIANTYAIDVSHLGSCPTFTSFTMDSISGDGARIHWKPGSGNTSYFLEYDTAGFTPGTGTMLTGNYPADTSMVVLTGLNPETTYDIYFVEICAGGDSVYTPAPYSFETTEPCQAPSGITVNGITPVSAKLNWDHIGATDEFYLIYGIRGFDLISSGDIDTVPHGMSHTLNGLWEGTWYDVYIVANCGSGYMSDTIHTLFKTECSPIQAPFFEDFEDLLSWFPRTFTNYNDTLDGCWRRTPSWIAEELDPSFIFDWAVRTGKASSSQYGPMSGQGGSGNYLYTSGSHGHKTGDEVIIYTPFIDVSTLAKPYLSFYYHRYGVYQPDCYVEVNDGTGWTTVITMKGPHQLQRNDPYDSTGIDISSFGDTVQVRFRASYIDDGSYMGLDNFEIKEAPPATCAEVTEIVNTGIGQDTTVIIDIVGEGQNFNFEWGPAGFEQGTGCIGQGASPFAMDSCIELNTIQEVYVQNNCQDSGLGVSPWTGPFEYCTPFTAPYSNDFDNEILESVPQCWNEYSRASVAASAQGAKVRLNSGKAFSDHQVLRLYDELLYPGDTFMALSPRFVDMPEGKKQIRFVAYAPNNFGDALPRELVVGTMSSYTEGSSFHPIDTFSLSKTSWREYIVSLDPLTTPYNGTDQIIALRYMSPSVPQPEGPVNFCMIDNFYYEEAPACLPPDMTTLKTAFVMDNRAKVQWVNRSGGNVNLEWGVRGFTPGTGNSAGTASTSDSAYTIPGLTPKTHYEVYIRTNCGGSGSYWIGPLKFKTACSISAPYFEDFDGSQWLAPSRIMNTYNCGDSIDNCWTRIKSCSYYDDGSTGRVYSTWGVQNKDGSVVSDDHGGGGNFIFPIATLRFDTARIYSPVIDISSLNNPYLSFYYHRSGNSMPEFWVSINNGDGQGWRKIMMLTGQQQISSAAPFRKAGIDISGYGDTVQIRFEAAQGGGLGSEMAIDDVRIDEAPSCSMPENLSVENIVDSPGSWTTKLEWEDFQQVATAYEVRIGFQGFADGGSVNGEITDTVVSKHYTIDTLLPNTCYEFIVRSLCGGDTGTFEGPFIFCTPCEPEVAPYLYPFKKSPNAQHPMYQNQTFEGGTDCWRGDYRVDGHGGYMWKSSSYDRINISGPEQGVYDGEYAYVVSREGDDGDVATLYSPIVDIRQLTTPELSFYYHMYGITIDTLHLDLYDGVQWYNSVATIGGPQQYHSHDPWRNMILDLDTFDATGYVQARFRIKKVGFQGDIAIDEFRIADSLTCQYPFNFRFEDSLATEATLRWSGDVADNYVIEYGPSGYTFGEGTEMIVSGDSVVVPVNDNRMYHGYIRSICGPGDTSDAVGPIQFNSRVFPCDDLEVYTPGPLDDQSTLFRPWNPVINDPLDNTGDYYVRGDEEISTAQSVSGTQSLHLYEGAVGGAGIITNTENVESGIYKVGFNIFIADTGGAVYEIFTSDNSYASAIFFFDGMKRMCNIYKYGGSLTYSFPFTGSWNKIEHIIDLDNDTTWMVVNNVDINIGWGYKNPGIFDAEAIRLHFLTTPSNFNVSGAASDFYIDDFCLEEFECPAPSALVVDQSSCTQAVVSWMEGINGSATLVEYDTTGFVRGTGLVLNAESNRDTLTGLTWGGTYDVYVGEICGYDTVFTGPLTITLPTEAVAGFTVDKDDPTATDLTVGFDGSISVGGDNYSWDFGDGNSGTGINPSHTYTANGTYTVQLIISSDCGSDTITKTVEISGISVEENILSRSLEVYPNPFSDKLYVKFETSGSEDAAIVLMDLSGKIVLKKSASDMNGRYESELDLSRLAKGSYMLRIESGEKHVVRKIVKE